VNSTDFATFFKNAFDAYLNQFVASIVETRMRELAETLRCHVMDAIKHEVAEAVDMQLARVVAQNEDIDHIIKRVVDSDLFESSVKDIVQATNTADDVIEMSVNAVKTEMLDKYTPLGRVVHDLIEDYSCSADFGSDDFHDAVRTVVRQLDFSVSVDVE
jgi:hypothetical protein